MGVPGCGIARSTSSARCHCPRSTSWKQLQSQLTEWERLWRESCSRGGIVSSWMASVLSQWLARLSSHPTSRAKGISKQNWFWLEISRLSLSLQHILPQPLLTLSKVVVNCSPAKLTFPSPKKLLGDHPMVRRLAHVQSLPTAGPPKLKWRKAIMFT